MVNKDITFIYFDDVQKQVYEQIAEEAKKRGYVTRITDDKFAKCEIGWYCEHVNFPQFSKFSVVMLHDITQQYGNWPNIWYREPWDKYDIGFLPSKVWIDNWTKSSQYYYSRPRHGIYLTGWPKADRLSLYMEKGKKESYIKEIGLDPDKPTILYAPAWENDNKQDEFVKAMQKLDVNILIKQAPWGPTYVQQIENIRMMRELHEGIPGVFQLDPKTSILDAIMVSDILVSEESSTMCEAVMMGKPAISVCNWLIPETTPSRYPSDDYDYVIKTKKEELTECVQEVLDNYEKYQKDAVTYSDEHFSNIGNCIPMMFDVLDSVIEGKEVKVPALTPAKKVHLSLPHWIKHNYIRFSREKAYNYCERIPFWIGLRKIFRKIKSIFKKK